jgi:nodulation protein E
MTNRVVVTGMGCVSGIGNDMPSTWANLVEMRSGITELSRAVDGSNTHHYSGAAATVQNFSLADVASRFGERAVSGLDPFSEFALPASLEAIDQAGLFNHPVLSESAALIYGGSAGGLTALEDAYVRVFLKNASGVHPLTIPRFMPSAAASQISMLFGFRGICFAISSACSSSSHAVIEGYHMVRSGRATVALVGGSEAPITYGHWLGWKAIRAMADDTCRPFSTGRKGMVLGEGAATLILEDRDHALARGATIIAEIAAGIANSDAHHLTQPQGDGAKIALRAAYDAAGIPIDTPALISAHGTGTPLNDKTEAKALREFYGDALHRTSVIATKSSHGHLIGATGALEFAIGLQALVSGVAPPILNHIGSDPECDLPLVLGVPKTADHDILVSNTFAFGGLNGVIIAKRH